jgi:hypothetical protein
LRLAQGDLNDEVSQVGIAKSGCPHQQRLLVCSDAELHPFVIGYRNPGHKCLFL